MWREKERGVWEKESERITSNVKECPMFSLRGVKSQVSFYRGPVEIQVANQGIEELITVIT